MEKKSVTIIGQGYVGLPLAQEASAANWKVFGFDISERVVANLNAGRSHVDDLSDDDVARMISDGYEATTKADVISDSNYVVICVPTPLGEGGSPDLSAVKSAVRTIADKIRPGTTVILESTTYPGTTEEMVRPLLEANSELKLGEDFYLAFSPERVNPGFPEFGIKNTPKIVGGVDEASTNAASAFYGDFVDTVVPLNGAKEAETAKLLENTFRHVNIALVNEMAKFSHEMGIDIWEVIRGAETKPFGFMKFTPGPGVGGHCIPIDPNYLSYEVRNELGYPFRFVELAQEINNSMPKYVVERVSNLLNTQRKALNGSIVLLLGVTYKENIADQRESPAVPVAARLLEMGAEVRFHDPLVQTWNLESGDIAVETDLNAAVQEADVVVVLQAHKAYDLEAIANTANLMLDTRGKAPQPAHRL